MVYTNVIRDPTREVVPRRKPEKLRFERSSRVGGEISGGKPSVRHREMVNCRRMGDLKNFVLVPT